MRPIPSIVPAPRVPCQRCAGKGVVQPMFRSALNLRGDKPHADTEPVKCSECGGAGGWQDRALGWEPIEGRCAVSPEGAVTVRPSNVTERLAVPGGWLVRSVRCTHDGVGVGLTFVPDPQGEWAPVAPLGSGGEQE